MPKRLRDGTARVRAMAAAKELATAKAEAKAKAQRKAKAKASVDAARAREEAAKPKLAEAWIVHQYAIDHDSRFESMQYDVTRFPTANEAARHAYRVAKGLFDEYEHEYKDEGFVEPVKGDMEFKVRQMCTDHYVKVFHLPAGEGHVASGDAQREWPSPPW
jgi:hypothetical protein